MSRERESRQSHHRSHTVSNIVAAHLQRSLVCNGLLPPFNLNKPKKVIVSRMERAHTSNLADKLAAKEPATMMMLMPLQN